MINTSDFSNWFTGLEFTIFAAMPVPFVGSNITTYSSLMNGYNSTVSLLYPIDMVPAAKMFIVHLIVDLDKG